MILLPSLFHSQGDRGTGRWLTCTARRRQIRDSTRRSKSRTCASVSYLSWQHLPPWGGTDGLSPDLVFLCFCFSLVLPRSRMQTSAPRLGTEPGPQHWKPTVRLLEARELPRGQCLLLFAIYFIYGNWYMPKTFHLEESNILNYFVNSVFFS